MDERPNSHGWALTDKAYFLCGIANESLRDSARSLNVGRNAHILIALFSDHRGHQCLPEINRPAFLAWIHDFEWKLINRHP